MPAAALCRRTRRPLPAMPDEGRVRPAAERLGRRVAWRHHRHRRSGGGREEAAAIRDHRVARAWRNGRCLQGAAAPARPHRRAENPAARGCALAGFRRALYAARRARWQSSITRTSSPSTTSAKRAGFTTSSWSIVDGVNLAAAPRSGKAHARRGAGHRAEDLRRAAIRARGEASCIATSSRRTCCSTKGAA